MHDFWKLAGSWAVGIIGVAALVVIGKDQQVVDTVFTDSTKMLGTAMGGSGF
jgi:hypothetical protein